ncbi:hypothetical protein MYAM1_000920 [Malassezia yamatoensis]|uniref:NudC domain-containing protein 1 n=1 Tax=Malassezia yamatoensis TaxID=253288 RepID=A0AAJ5YSX4_9BASI|nr:hypothetical protein MYAM1_000920 [Malassezia yamatoensis]
MPLLPVNHAEHSPHFETYRLDVGEDVHCQTYPLPCGAFVEESTLSGYKELKARAMQNALTVLASNALMAYIDRDCYLTIVYLEPQVEFIRMQQVSSNATLCAMDSNTIVCCDMEQITHFVIDLATKQSSASRYPIPKIDVKPGESVMNWRVVAARNDRVLLERARRYKAAASNTAHETKSGLLHDRTQTSFDIMLLNHQEQRWHIQNEQPITYAMLADTCLLGAEAPLGLDTCANALQKGTYRNDSQPYTWTQTDESIILALALPASIEKHTIQVKFSSNQVSIEMAFEKASVTEIHTDSDASENNEELIRNGKYQGCDLWGQIVPEHCTYTWESLQTKTGNQVHDLSVLKVLLSKTHRKTRWPEIFKGADVPETVDPSELMMMLEGLEKYTETQEHSSLLQNELEEEDTEVGAPFLLTEVRADGTYCSAKQSEAGVILACPTPSNPTDFSIMLKRDVDGVVMKPPTHEFLSEWYPEANVPAIAYVLASKREAHPIYFHRNGDSNNINVLAFEPRRATVHDLSYNLYIYHVAPKSRYGKSRVIRLGTAKRDQGVLLGVAISNQHHIVCLFESELQIVQGALFL